VLHDGGIEAGEEDGHQPFTFFVWTRKSIEPFRWQYSAQGLFQIPGLLSCYAAIV
jgi:hypothetical protein